jgi:LuxR family maltose regulon positive regulatory protein
MSVYVGNQSYLEGGPEDGGSGERALFAPEPAPHSLVHRQRLVDLIEQPNQAPLTLVIAGAGYGKTTLVADWMMHAAQPVSWLRVLGMDNDPGVLTGRIRMAVRVADDHLPDGTGPASTHDVDSFHATLESNATPLTLVLDNAEALTSPAAITVLDHLIATMPGWLQFIVISRRRLPLKLGRMRAQGQVRELDANDLRFTERESVEALQNQLPSRSTQSGRARSGRSRRVGSPAYTWRGCRCARRLSWGRRPTGSMRRGAASWMTTSNRSSSRRSRRRSGGSRSKRPCCRT